MSNNTEALQATAHQLEISLAKLTKRADRLESRLGRLKLVHDRAAEAGDNAGVARCEKEAKRRLSELNYLKDRIEAVGDDLKAAEVALASAPVPAAEPVPEAPA